MFVTFKNRMTSAVIGVWPTITFSVSDLQMSAHTYVRFSAKNKYPTCFCLSIHKEYSEHYFSVKHDSRHKISIKRYLVSSRILTSCGVSVNIFSRPSSVSSWSLIPVV